MLRYILVTEGLLIIFIAGFISGTFWQSRQESSRDLSVPAMNPIDFSADVSVQTTAARLLSDGPAIGQGADKPESISPIDKDSLDSQEHRLAEAMKDPEFKKLHDHLMRGKTQEWNFPSLPARSGATVKE